MSLTKAKFWLADSADRDYEVRLDVGVPGSVGISIGLSLPEFKGLLATALPIVDSLKEASK